MQVLEGLNWDGLEVLESTEMEVEGVEILESSWHGGADAGLDTGTGGGSLLGSAVAARSDVVDRDVSVSGDGWVKSDARVLVCVVV